eukprot:scaffold114500_cov14-Tisochrysis_lutea.AAC.1
MSARQKPGQSRSKLCSLSAGLEKEDEIQVASGSCWSPGHEPIYWPWCRFRGGGTYIAAQ